MTSLVVIELLCYVPNNFAKHPHTQVGMAINGVFTDAEVLDMYEVFVSIVLSNYYSLRDLQD